ncbi:MAG: hypothetical protein U1B94_02385 [candidate division NC10 bacterium]|nr:hypothetical protein [candidate division NC10 bacterium]
MGLSELLSFVIPASVLGIAYVFATLTFRKLPAGIPFLNFHVVAYGVLLALNLLLMVLMEKIRAVDLNVDDATVFLTMLFAGLGTVSCLVLAPCVWFFRRRSSFQPVTQYVINFVVGLPYIAVVLILLFYRE